MLLDLSISAADGLILLLVAGQTPGFCQRNRRVPPVWSCAPPRPCSPQVVLPHHRPRPLKGPIKSTCTRPHSGTVGRERRASSSPAGCLRRTYSRLEVAPIVPKYWVRLNSASQRFSRLSHSTCFRTPLAFVTKLIYTC
ncbi:hypothetical protein PLESTB_001758500 [Pleodorina starrii]|uniref:Secreted protein n=1 Tax=Pleodorina starrii TaxID=330485 RepID=A0A9W6C0E7_9CHLO|nr:hypothetical protein PLESTB_001758500 [Pleodorina starrii]